MEAHAIFEPLDPALVSIVVEFNQLLDDNSANISRAKALVLDLEERLEQLGTSPNTVSISIKRKLQRKIAERKISTRWIHSCLPPKWKRVYRKRELNSFSAVASEQEMHNADEENIVLLQEINGLQGHHMQLKQENYPPIVCIKFKEGFNAGCLNDLNYPFGLFHHIFSNLLLNVIIRLAAS